MKRYILILYSMLICVHISLSQNVNKTVVAKTDTIRKELVVGKLSLQAKGYKDKIALRWGLDNAAAWPFLQHIGVHIDLVEMDEKNNTLLTDWIRVTSEPIKPWSKDYFQQAGVMNAEDDNLLVAAQALYGQLGTGQVNTKDMNAVQEADIAYNNMFLLAMMAADFSPKAAQALGLYYSYSTPVNKNHKYAFRVYSAQQHDVIKIDTAYYIYAGFALDEIIAPAFVSAKGKDEIIEISWPKNNAYNKFTSYNIERSLDSIHFEKINANPVVFNLSDDTKTDFIYADSVSNYVKYYYRINGTDAFGDVSYYSEPRSAMAVNQLSPYSPSLTANLSVGKDKVELNWTQKVDPNRPLRGFIIRRGEDRNKLDQAIHSEILKPDSRSFVDVPKNLTKGYFYQVMAIDTSDNYVMSDIKYIFAFDTIPPKAPIGMKGLIDTLGRVTLTWENDRSDNVYAYRIFAANSPNNTFSPVTAALVRDTSFVDSISFNVSNRKIYYKIVALDGSNNHSEMSEVLVLDKPKVIASPAPVISDFQVLDKKVSITFAVLPDEETQKILIFRKVIQNNSNAAWQEIASLAPEARAYMDSTVNTGTRYLYMVRSKDVFNMFSDESVPLEVLVYHVSLVAPDLKFDYVKNKENGIKLKWNTPKEKVLFYILYKDTGNGMTEFKSLEATENLFEDDDKGVLRYGIKAMYENKDIDNEIVIKKIK
ncbi:fibronectin type III domain-containing protein [Sphingobacterium bovistauri]|uniref:Fibronectin type 3 domain-containing protein n=1 Tax=Sphingobacterium bovistauri TaxID=2781959 RepID=A0ABS7Z339_9SPHI|nr:hypothetical protein [Sphingobacterium bovistauri]MCA5004535.1 hypothetical protein [Sphingobacterium bovistauri]